MGVNWNGATNMDYSTESPFSSREGDHLNSKYSVPGTTAVVGRWIAPAAGSIIPFTTMLNRVYVDDFHLPAKSSISDIACHVSTAGTAGAVLRMGIYSDKDGMPDKLLAETTGTADATTTGAKSLPITSGVLLPGRYWLAAVSQIATCGTYGNNKNVDQYWASSAAAALQYSDVGFVHDGVTGVLPVTFVSVGPVDTAIRVTAKIAAP